MRNIKELTGLRWLAAFYVFLFHIDMPQRTPLTYLPWRLEAIIQEGRLGVTLFFILSGFVLTYSHLKDFHSAKFKGLSYLRSFMYKRFARIYPVYLSGLLLCIAMSYLFEDLPPLEIIFLSSTFLQTYIPEFAMKWYDAGAWSVGNEIFFYLLFPIALPLLLAIKKKFILFILLAASILFGTFTELINYQFISSPFPFPVPWSWGYWFPPMRLPEFIAGITTALLVFKFNWRVSALTAVILLGVTMIYLSYFGPLLPSTSIHNWLVVLTIAFLLSALSQQKESIFFKWLSSKLMQYLGQISYCFYIFQIPLTLTLDKLIESKAIDSTNWHVLPICFLINLIGAILFHEFIEKKAHCYLINYYNKRKNIKEELNKRITAI